MLDLLQPLLPAFQLGDLGRQRPLLPPKPLQPITKLRQAQLRLRTDKKKGRKKAPHHHRKAVPRPFRGCPEKEKGKSRDTAVEPCGQKKKDLGLWL